MTTKTTTTTTMEEEDKKRNLIRQATTRLRRLELEEQLSGMMAGLVDLQTQSKYLYDQLSHAMSTAQNLQDFDIGQQHQQMDLLEIQCKLYQQVMLHQGFPTTMKIDHVMTTTTDAMSDDHDSTNMSRHSSLSMIPSLFSSGSISSLTSSNSSVTSISEFTDMDSDNNNADEVCSMSSGDLCATAATKPEKKAPMGDQQLGRSHQRRLRVKYHRQRYQYRQQYMKKTDDQDSVLVDLAMASTASSSASLLRKHQTLQQNATSMHRLGKMETSPPPPSSFLSLPPSPSSSCSSFFQPPPPTHSYSYNSTNDASEYCDSGMMDDNRSDIGFSDYGVSNMDSYRYGHYHQGNDDTTVDDFLDQMDAIVKDIDDCDGYDESFFQDMAFLLDQPTHHPSEHTKKDLAPLTEGRHDMDRRFLRSSSSSSCGITMDLSPESTHGPSPAPSPYIDHLCHSGWQWCRFLSVLSASYMVSLLKGPDDLLLD